MFFLLASLVALTGVVRAADVAVNLTGTYQWPGTVSVWGDTQAISLVYQWPGFASVWRDSAALPYVYTYGAAGSVLPGFLYILCHDNATGVPACFPYRPCRVDFAIPNIESNVTISVDNQSFFFNNVNNGVIENSFVFVHNDYSNATLYVVPDANQTRAFNYTILLVTSTRVSSLTYKASATEITFYVTVLFQGYNIPAPNETINVTINNQPYTTIVTNSTGQATISIPLSYIPNNSTVCFNPVHGQGACATITYQGPGGPSVTVSIPELNYTPPNLTFPTLRPTVPGLTTISNIMASFAFLALFIWLSMRVSYTYALVVTGAVMAGYGSSIQVAFGHSTGASALVIGGIIAIIGGFLLQYIRR